MKKVIFTAGISSVILLGAGLGVSSSIINPITSVLNSSSTTLSSTGSNAQSSTTSNVGGVVSTSTSTSVSTSSNSINGSASGSIQIGNKDFGASVTFNALFNAYGLFSKFFSNESFDVTDIGKNYITTKIANQPFYVELRKKFPYVGIVRVDLIKNPANQEECDTNPALASRYVLVFPMPFMKTIIRFNYPYAIKDAKFRVKYLDRFPKSCAYLVKPIPDRSYIPQCMNDLRNERKTYITNCLNKLPANPTPYQVIQCVFDNANSSCSSDDFAIRPYAFLVFGQNQYKRAGENFNIIIKAVDEQNYNKTQGTASDVQGVKGYNENINNLDISANFYVPTDDETRQMNVDVYDINDTNRTRVAYCPDPGSFNLVKGDSFVNGEDNVTLSYSETGVLTLKVSEINGSEFAKVDEKDTNDSQRLIKPATFIVNESNLSQRNLLLEFIPYKFVTNGEYNSTTNSFVYMNNEVNNMVIPKMAAFIDYNITAQNKQGEVLKNFTKTCFPDVTANAPKRNGLKLNTTFDLFLDAYINVADDTNKTNLTFANIDTTDNSHIWLLHSDYNLTEGNHHIQQWVSPLNFKNGNSKVRLYFSMTKDYRHPKNEVNITVYDINTSTSWMNNPGATKIFVKKDINKTVNFRYGRVYMQNISGYGNELNTTFQYQYWTDEGWVVNKGHNASLFGEVKITHPMYAPNPSDITLNVIKQNNKDVVKGIEKVNISTTHALPYSAKIHFAIPSWLWYHPLAKDYEDPSASNKDCLTHPCMSVSFQKNSLGWGGIGNNNSYYSETNRTSEINSSNDDNNAPKNVLKRINW